MVAQCRNIDSCLADDRQDIFFKEQLGNLADCNPSEQDFENQRKAYRLIVDYLEEKGQYKITENEE